MISTLVYVVQIHHSLTISGAFTFAPAAINICITSQWPLCAAACRGVDLFYIVSLERY